MKPINLHDYEELARQQLPQMVFDYYCGGAEDELTVGENRRGWQRLRLRPRVLVDVGTRDLATTVLGRAAFVSRADRAVRLQCPGPSRGRVAVARAATAAGIIQVVSTAGTYSLEEVAAAAPSGVRWFQLYCYRDRGVTAGAGRACRRRRLPRLVPDRRCPAGRPARSRHAQSLWPAAGHDLEEPGACRARSHGSPRRGLGAGAVHLRDLGSPR